MAQILVVDDQEDIVQLVAKALELQNHKVTEAGSIAGAAVGAASGKVTGKLLK